MRVLVLQHLPVEHPGSFRDFLSADGIAWDTVELDEGAAIPSLDPYAAMLVMGGPMDVWEERRHPWLVAEKAAIRSWVGSGRPFLGVCLGHQLLADALGGRVGPMPAPEVGLSQVDIVAADDPLFHGLPSSLECVQWHGSAVEVLPPGASVIAVSEACRVQAFRAGAAAWGIQFHVEVTADTVAEWSCIPAYATALRAAMGEAGQTRLQQQATERLPALTEAARTLYGNFRQLF